MANTAISEVSLRERLLSTNDSWAPLLLRLGLGLMLLPHGLQKAFGAFGGNGFDATQEFFTQSLGLPWILGFAAIFTESAGAFLLLLGFGTRIWALGIGILMLVASHYHLANGFFMNWFGNQKGEGIEFHLLSITMAAALFLLGGGRWSVDRRLEQR